MVSEIIWTNEALSNLKEIKDFVSKDSEFYALRLITLIYSSVDQLIKHPEIGKIVPYKQPYLLRRILVKKYRVIYTVRNNTLFIIAVYHSSRQLPPEFDLINSLFE